MENSMLPNYGDTPVKSGWCSSCRMHKEALTECSSFWLCIDCREAGTCLACKADIDRFMTSELDAKKPEADDIIKTGIWAGLSKKKVLEAVMQREKTLADGWRYEWRYVFVNDKLRCDNGLGGFVSSYTPKDLGLVPSASCEALGPAPKSEAKAPETDDMRVPCHLSIGELKTIQVLLEGAQGSEQLKAVVAGYIKQSTIMFGEPEDDDCDGNCSDCRCEQ